MVGKKASLRVEAVTGCGKRTREDCAAVKPERPSQSAAATTFHRSTLPSPTGRKCPAGADEGTGEAWEDIDRSGDKRAGEAWCLPDARWLRPAPSPQPLSRGERGSRRSALPSPAGRRCPEGADEGTGEAWKTSIAAATSARAKPGVVLMREGSAPHPHPNPSPGGRVAPGATRSPSPAGRRCPEGADEGTGEAWGNVDCSGG